MAFLGTPNAYLGVDIGTSSLKVIELLDRKNRLEVAAYAEANLPNLLVDAKGEGEEEVKRTADVLKRMVDDAGVSSDAVVAALPSGIVFSTVITLPDLPEKNVNEAIRFAARDVVPADLDEMVLSWRRLGDGKGAKEKRAEIQVEEKTVPIFLTAAPKEVISRYERVIDMANLELKALEVETFPLVRSLLERENDTAMIVDIGDLVTTYHVVDKGTPQVSHSVEIGGQSITNAIAGALGVSEEEAESAKVQYGLGEGAPEKTRLAIANAVQILIDQGVRLLDIHNERSGGEIGKTVLIGGGAKLKKLDATWSEAVKHKVTVGNPWKGLAYPNELSSTVLSMGPTFAVAIGLAQRGFTEV